MNYQLKNDDLSVELTTKGGALTSIRDMSGREYLWQGRSEILERPGACAVSHLRKLKRGPGSNGRW